MLALSWPHVGPSWPYVGPRLAYVGPMLAHVGPILAHLGAYVGATGAVFLAKYVATPSRCQLCRFFPFPGAQNHVKTTVFARRQDKIRGRRRARNTVKTDVFERRAQNTPQITGSSVGGGVRRGLFGGRGRSAYNLRLPTEGLPPTPETCWVGFNHAYLCFEVVSSTILRIHQSSIPRTCFRDVSGYSDVPRRMSKAGGLSLFL